MLHQEAHIKATKEATTVKTRQQELVRIGARKEEGHFNRSQEGSSMRIPLARTEGEGNLPMPSGLHHVRVVYPL